MKTFEKFLQEKGFTLTNKSGGEKSYPASYMLKLMKEYEQMLSAHYSK